MLSVELGLSVAIIEIISGAVVRHTLHLATPDWMVFLTSFGRLTCADEDHAQVQPAHRRLSFAVPFVGVLLACRYGFGFDWKAARIGGIALSTTSLAVVYAVLVKTGLNATWIGKLIMSSTFVTDLDTVLALSALFITSNWWLVPFVLVSVALIVLTPQLEGVQTTLRRSLVRPLTSKT